MGRVAEVQCSAGGGRSIFVSWLRKLFGRAEPSDTGDVMRERQTDQPGRLRDPDADARADRQQADTTGLVREGEPRGGMGAEDYNTAGPLDIVEEGGVAMSGPAGAPQDGSTPDERRAEQRDLDPPA
jgi:hypothetical protein